ncbi:MAG: DNA repair protein RadA, partial [Betaproteobacteria bacterium]|nr:DNA repair protein RadA [Betaproteobacteria bacterium]
MAKPKTSYTCTECGASALQWFGSCPSCGTAGTLVETISERGLTRQAKGAATGVTLAEVTARELARIPTG